MSTGARTRRLLKIVGWLILAVPVVVLLYPIEAAVAPSIRVQVLDVDGQPARNVVVQQNWGFHSISSPRLETKRTDENGIAEFPARTVHSPMVMWIVGLPWGLLSHNGWGEYASVWAFGSDPHVWTLENCGIDFVPPMVLQLKRWDTTIYPSR